MTRCWEGIDKTCHGSVFSISPSYQMIDKEFGVLNSTSLYYPLTMIILTLLHFCISSRTQTLSIPVDHPLLPPAVCDFQSILRRENAPSNTRTIWNIIWSCFSTLFACAWIAVHPNIPAPEDSRWKILRRRMMIMAYVLLGPEIVIIWAARQHRDANVLAKKFQIEGRPGWTKTHAFFLIMGGFTLHANGRPIRVLEWKDLKALARAGRVDWPSITEEEIKDRSKGDYLSKGIVVLQTTWFTVQFFARVASKLTITELEVVTLAFSTFIGVIYYLWWDKPLDVRCSVPVHLVELNIGQATPGNITDEDFSPKDFCFCCLLPLDISPALVEGGSAAELEGEEVGTGNRYLSSPPDFPNSPPHIQDSPRFNSEPTMIGDSPFSPVQADFPRRSTPSVSWMKRLRLLIQTSCRRRGTFLGLIYVFVILPTNFLLISQFHAMMDECTIEADTHESNDHLFDTSLHNGPLRVPTFYSYSGYSLDRVVFGACVSVLFGAMHCIAWHHEFSSSPERWGWRLSSIIMSVAPLILLSVLMVSQWMGITTRLSTRSSPIFHIFHVSFAWPYIASRIVLLLFPLIALRALPPGAHAELDWATIIPHI